METTYIVTGTLTDQHTVRLDEALPLSPMKVQLILAPIPATPPRSYVEVMAEIRQRQQARGYQPPTRAEVDAELQAERDSWIE